VRLHLRPDPAHTPLHHRVIGTHRDPVVTGFVVAVNGFEMVIGI